MEPKILTIDDDAVIRATVCASLHKYACRVIQAANGPDGLALARRELPDLILLDCELPRLSGDEVLRELKSDPDLHNIPVVMLTINSQREDVMRILSLGVRDYVLKPFKRDSLIERLGRIVKLRPKEPPTGSVGKPAKDSRTLLVVDDKPAILEQIRSALAGTAWVVQSVTEPEQVLDSCRQNPPDLVLLSLSLPGDFGFSLYPILREQEATKTVPVLGLVVKAALQEQLRAQEMGFDGFITKPIDPGALPVKLGRALNTDEPHEYFQHRENCLVIAPPSDLDAPQAKDAWQLVHDKILAEIDAGVNRVILDLSQVAAPSASVIQLIVRVVKLCAESDLRYSLIGGDALSAHCAGLSETKDLEFVTSFEEALAALDTPAQTSA